MKPSRRTCLIISIFAVAATVELAEAQQHRRESKDQPKKQSYKKGASRSDKRTSDRGASRSEKRTSDRGESHSDRRTIIQPRSDRGNIRHSDRRREEYYRDVQRGHRSATIEVYPRYTHQKQLVHLPHQHREIHYHDRTIYYCRHAFYEPTHMGRDVVYVAVDPPIGVTIDEIPDDSTTVIVGADTYYYGGGFYFRRVSNVSVPSYTLVTAPVGAVVYTIPDESTTTIVSGRTYYTYGGVHYRRVFAGGRVSYMVVAGID